MEFPQWMYRMETGQSCLVPSQDFLDSLPEKERKLWTTKPWYKELHVSDPKAEIAKLKQLVETLEEELREKDQMIVLLNQSIEQLRVKKVK
jgi:hypothetical protein